MFKLMTTWFVFHFWASPHHTIDKLLAMSDDVWADREALKTLTPGFPVNTPVDDPIERPGRPVPTDVPVPEPRDVPVPEPHDVPVPDPGTEPTPAKPTPQKKQNEPKPRSVP